MVSANTIIDLALQAEGKPYRFGYEVDLNDANPEAFDCSELVQWACYQAGVDPVMPDGTWAQEIHCRNAGTLITVEEAVNTRGALLFRHRDGSSNPVEITDWTAAKRASSGHVAFSLGEPGERGTIEAMGTAYGCLRGNTAQQWRSWTAGFLIPGVSYDGSPSTATPVVVTPTAPHEPHEPHAPVTPVVGDGIDRNAEHQACRGSVYGGSPIARADSDVTAVAVVQTGVNKWRLDNGIRPYLDVDGDFGPVTGAGVNQFLRAIGRRETERVGRAAWHALDLTLDIPKPA